MDGMEQGPGALAAQAAAPQQASAEGLDPKMMEAVQLVVGRAQSFLEKSAQGLDAALKADPVAGAVEFGVRALRATVQAAEKAGKPLPFQVVINSGMVLIQIIGAIAGEKGYLQEADVETFLKESFQQSVAAYTKLDHAEGLISDEQVMGIGKASGGKPPPATPAESMEE